MTLIVCNAYNGYAKVPVPVPCPEEYILYSSTHVLSEP